MNQILKKMIFSTILDSRFKKLHFRSTLSVSIVIEKVCKLIKTRQNVATNANEPQNSLAPVANNTNVWSIYDELVSSTTKCFDEPGVPVELRQFLS